MEEALAFLIPHTAWQNLLMFLKTENVITTWGGTDTPQEHMEKTEEVACEGLAS